MRTECSLVFFCSHILTRLKTVSWTQQARALSAQIHKWRTTTGSRTTAGKWTRNYTEGLSGGCVSGHGNRVSAGDGRTLKSALGQLREDVRHQWQEAVFPLRWLHVVSTSPQLFWWINTCWETLLLAKEFSSTHHVLFYYCTLTATLINAPCQESGDRETWTST